jgi:hypothetical protein
MASKVKNGMNRVSYSENVHNHAVFPLEYHIVGSTTSEVRSQVILTVWGAVWNSTSFTSSSSSVRALETKLMQYSF